MRGGGVSNCGLISNWPQTWGNETATSAGAGIIAGSGFSGLDLSLLGEFSGVGSSAPRQQQEPSVGAIPEQSATELWQQDLAQLGVAVGTSWFAQQLMPFADWPQSQA